MKLLIDMNLSPRWVAFLQGEGFAATHWSSIGAGTASDREILDFARANDFVVLTQDLDFGAILAATRSDKPSVIQIRAGDTSPDIIGKALVSAIGRVQSEIDAGALLTFEPSRSRLRLLPLT